jgi:predicted metal-dependent peptidase
MSQTQHTLISGSVMRLRHKAPFYSVLAMHAEWRADPSIGTAATDGEVVVFNPEFFESMSPEHRDAVVAHEVTHIAMRHCGRCGPRDPTRWNIAADVVTNGMVESMGLRLPPGCIRDTELQTLSVEEVYQRIEQPSDNDKRKLGVREGHKHRDLLKGAPGKMGASSEGEDAARWRDAVRKALVVQRMHDKRAGTQSFNGLREVEGLLDPQVDWRTLLWRYVVQTPFDYSGWDRRFIHRGIYTEDLTGENLTVAACLDTSASVDQRMLRALLSELAGIRYSHPRIQVAVYFADTVLHGPYWLSPDEALPIPIGGGGTTFSPFFEAIDPHMCPSNGEEQESVLEPRPDVAIYLTDGWATVPESEPDIPTMWLVPVGARTEFPWGEVVHMDVDGTGDPQ